MPGPVIPFYGADDPAMFALERQAMDRSGRVIAALDRLLPSDGLILDVGAGDGHTAGRLTTDERTVVGLEPTLRPGPDVDQRWVAGAAPDFPFAPASFDGAYSTWAYFFPDYHDIQPALAGLDLAVKSGGPIIIVDNAGDDEFCSMTDRKIATDPAVWQRYGFDVEIIETAFEFESLADAQRLLSFFFGPETTPVLQIGFRVAVAIRMASPDS